MTKRSWEERRRETNARYYQNKKAREQGQQSDSAGDSGNMLDINNW